MPQHNDLQFVWNYKQLEDQFFHHVLRSDLQQLLDMEDLHDAYLFGEIGFLIAGLKPCVLIDLPHDIAVLYKEHVLDQVSQEHLTPRGIEIVEIKANVSSPEISLQGCFIVYRKSQKDVVQPLLLLSQDGNDNDDHNNNQHVISESTLANILDYPGSLPSNQHEIMCMLEVVYYIQEENHTVQIVTTFAALDHEVEEVKAHFENYRSICHEKLGLDIKLLIRRPQ